MMKTILINKNPAISRLISLSLNKLQIDYEELDCIDKIDYCDILIVDNDCKFDINLLKNKTDKLILLLGKNETCDEAVVINKPFLPTDFIDLITNLKNDILNSKDDFKQIQNEVKNIINDSIVLNNNLSSLSKNDNYKIIEENSDTYEICDDEICNCNFPETFEELSKNYQDLLMDNDDMQENEDIKTNDISNVKEDNFLDDISNLKEEEISLAINESLDKNDDNFNDNINNFSKAITSAISEAVTNSSKDSKNYIKDIKISINISFKD